MALTNQQSNLVVRLLFNYNQQVKPLQFQNLGLFTTEIEGTPLQYDDYVAINSVTQASQLFNTEGATYKAIVTAFSQKYAPKIIYIFKWVKSDITTKAIETLVKSDRVITPVEDYKTSFNFKPLFIHNNNGYQFVSKAQSESDDWLTVDLSSEETLTFDIVAQKLTEQLHTVNLKEYPELANIETSTLQVGYDSNGEVFTCTYSNGNKTNPPFVLLPQSQSEFLPFFRPKTEQLRHGVIVQEGHDATTQKQESANVAFNRSLTLGVYYYCFAFIDQLNGNELKPILSMIEGLTDNPKITVYRADNLTQYSKGGYIDNFTKANYKRSRPMYTTDPNGHVAVVAFLSGFNYGEQNGFGTPFGKRLVGVTPEDLTDPSPVEKNNGYLYNQVGSTELLMQYGEPLESVSVGDYIQNTAQAKLLDLFSGNNINIYSEGHNLVANMLESVCLGVRDSGAITKGTWYGQAVGNVKHGDTLQNGYFIYYEDPNKLTQDKAKEGILQTFTVGLIPVRYARAVTVNVQGNL